MGNYELLKAAINEVIKANGRQEITGEVLNQVLLSMVNSLGAGYQCMGVATPSTNPGTPDQNVFYFATQAGTYTNFDAIVLQAGISVLMWDGEWASQTWFTVDSSPSNNSQNLIASGAVFNALKLDGGAYDVSAHNSGATFASLSALLNSANLNTLIPTEIRHGGMSIKFVQSSDNKYVQYRLMSDSFNTTLSNWQGIDAEPTAGSNNLATSGGVYKSENKLSHQIGNASNIQCTAAAGGWTNDVYIELYQDEVLTFNVSGTGASVRMIQLFYDGAFHTSEVTAPPLTIPHDASRIRFYTWGTNVTVTFTILGIKQELDGIKSQLDTKESLSDKINEWSDEPSKIKYPSEVLAYTLKQSIDLIPGQKYSFSKDEAGFKERTDLNIISGLTYYITCTSGQSFSVVQLFDVENEQWVSVNTEVITRGATASFIAPINSKRLRIYFNAAAGASADVFTDSYTSYLDKKIKDVGLTVGYKDVTTPILPSDFDNIGDLCTKLNQIFKGSYSAFCKCNDNCMAYLFENDATRPRGVAGIFDDINHNFRKDVVFVGMTHERLAYNINKAIQEKINLFNDAKLNTTDSISFSLSTGLQADEPSAVVSPDGEKLYIYAHLKRIETNDGVNWSESTPLVLSGSGEYPSYILHCGVNYIDGVYYLIGCDNNTGGNLHLFTSTDGINFNYQGILFRLGFAFNTGYTADNWGNPYLIKEYGSGKLYLYIEIQPHVEGETRNWVNCLIIYTDILHQNEDGTIGDGDLTGIDNPVLVYDYNGHSTGNYITGGNIDFAKLSDNRPIKSDGKYFCYFHTSYSGSGSIIARASSTDLINWTVDGICYNNRDIPTAGQYSYGNADHCVIEFKGRTYMFYSWDINDEPRLPYIKYIVDDRPFNEILSLMP